MNNISLMGRLTADVELKQTPNGNSVCTFTLAVDRPKTKDTTDFIRCVAWKGTAEFISRYFKKGNRMAAVGVLTSRSYKGDDGKNKTIYEVLVDNVEFCESKSASTTAEPAYNCYSGEPHFEEIGTDEDLPF